MESIVKYLNKRLCCDINKKYFWPLLVKIKIYDTNSIKYITIFYTNNFKKYEYLFNRNQRISGFVISNMFKFPVNIKLHN